eukprot:PhF_6_TR22275/c0_g1_i2/m.31503
MPTNFSCLPHDTLSLVCSYISDPLQLLNLIKVSKSFFAVSCDDSLWESHVRGLQMYDTTDTPVGEVSISLRTIFRNEVVHRGDLRPLHPKPVKQGIMQKLTSLFRKSTTRRIRLLGLYGSGKSTLLYLLKARTQNDILRTIPYIGFHTEQIQIFDMNIESWDVDIEDEQNRILSSYQAIYQYTGVHGFVWVVDSTDKDALKKSWDNLKHIFL